MAMYRSALKKKSSGRARKQRTKILAYLRTCHTQYTRVSSGNNMINIAAKVAWTRIPTVKSVKGRNASSALSHDFALSEIITSAFKTAVIGKVMMLKMMRKIRKAMPEREGWCSLLPNTRSASSPAGLVVKLKFVVSRPTISDFRLLSELVLF